MAKKISTAIGVDIGSQQIKIAEIKVQGKDAAVTALGIADTPAGTVDHTGVYDAEAIGAVLKELLASTGSTAQHVVISVAGQASVLVRTLEVPKMNSNELKEHMQWEITRNIPFAESTIVSDFKAFEQEDPSAPNMDVVMAISPQSAVETLVSLVKKAGKQAAAIDVEPLAIARSLSESYSEAYKNQTVCVVDIGQKSTAINLYKDGKLLLPRQVPIGGENFTQAIADNLGLSLEEAELTKKLKGHIPEAASGSVPQNPFAVPGEETQGLQPFNPFADTIPPAVANPPEQSNPYASSYEEPSASVSAYSAALPAEPEPFNPFTISDEEAHQPYVPALEPDQVFSVGSERPLDPGVTLSTDAYGQAEDAFVAPAADMQSLAPVGGADDAESIRVYNAMAGVLDEFLSELRRSIDYFRSKGGEVDRIELCGGGSKLGGMVEFINNTIGIQSELYDPFSGLNMSTKKFDVSLLEGNRHNFAVAVGNGLHICF